MWPSRAHRRVLRRSSAVVSPAWEGGHEHLGLSCPDGQHRARRTGGFRLPTPWAGRRSSQPLHTPTPGSPLLRHEASGHDRRPPPGCVLPKSRLRGCDRYEARNRQAQAGDRPRSQQSSHEASASPGGTPSGALIGAGTVIRGRECETPELRRHIAIIRSRFPILVACVVLAGGAAFLAASRLPNVDEAMATLIVGNHSRR